MSQAETREIALKFQDISQPFQCFSLFLFGCDIFVSPRTAARQTSVSFAISLGLLKFMPTESVMLSDHLILCRPLLLQRFLRFLHWHVDSVPTNHLGSPLQCLRSSNLEEEEEGNPGFCLLSFNPCSQSIRTVETEFLFHFLPALHILLEDGAKTPTQS